MASDQARWVHSIDFWQIDDDGSTPIFNTKINTYDDWHLAPSARPVFTAPSIRTKYVEVPMYNGYLDMTEAFGRGVMYGPRKGEMTFFVLNDYGYWAERWRTIEDYLHGKNVYCALNDDPNWWYEGRWEITWQNNNDGICSSITLAYTLQPDRIAAIVEESPGGGSGNDPGGDDVSGEFGS